MTHKDKKPKKEEKKVVEEMLQQADHLQKAQEYLAGWQRAQADYQTLQRDTARRLSDTVKYANEGLLIELLPIVDYFQYAFKEIPEAERNSSWLRGIEHIRTNFMKVLEDNDVKLIPTIGETFNPDLHEALDEVEVEGKKSGTIVEEVSPGFTLHGRVIRHAKVKTAK